ncbi:hypothetical protein EYC84_001329 [Monilinia fructicola]|uniref:Uncharacterized protein n=1 Tax=Monilinia fructicola TaxID=38448 RepID=A0A5M9JPM8_MONFR|nr:hypothetical protein EYC84_001329 [Monilinia fructicola]
MSYTKVESAFEDACIIKTISPCMHEDICHSLGSPIPSYQPHRNKKQKGIATTGYSFVSPKSKRRSPNQTNIVLSTHHGVS